MSNDQLHMLASITWAAFAYFGIVFAVQVFLLPGVVETYRQRLFDIRRELTLFALRHGVDKEDLPVYRNAVAEICTAIRVAQMLTFMRIVLLSPLTRRAVASYPSSLTMLEKVRDHALRAQVEETHKKLADASIAFVVVRSPVALLVGFVLLAASVAAGLLAALRVGFRAGKRAAFRVVFERRKRRALRDARTRVWREFEIDDYPQPRATRDMRMRGRAEA